MALIPARVDTWGAMAMMCLRYGTVPVARRTGGLADAVIDYLPSAVTAKTATGFHFEHASGSDLMKSLLLALAVFRSKKEWRQIVVAGMKTDVSWKVAAQSYVDLYEQLAAAPSV